MKTAVRKLEVKDVEKLHAIVIENAEDLEPGLTVLDYRLLLGHATIDAVARDANGSLVLMAIGFTADEEMLLKAVEAYSWCLEYPDAIRRLYNGVELSEARPPRLVFVIERMPDSFHRKMKQLGFPDVDCVEFRLLDVDGTPAVYFEHLARLRRTTISEADTRPVVARPAPAEPVIENVVALGGTQRAASARLQKLLTQANVESAVARPAPAREVAPVVSMISRTSAAAVVEAEPAARIQPAAVAVLEAAPEPEPAPSVEVLLEASPLVETKAEAESVDPATGFEGLPTLEMAGPSEPAAVNGHAPTAVVEPVEETHVEPEIVEPAPIAFREVVQVAAPKPAEPAPAVPEPKRVSFAEAAAKALLQQTRPVAPVQVEEGKPEATAEAKPAAAPPGFEGLQFPGDGQLTRQWMEFLNQMAAAKK
ncbi:MAG: hypothetical protein ACRELS_13020 [Candidatus Rokuibacteriota bacterium]